MSKQVNILRVLRGRLHMEEEITDIGRGKIRINPVIGLEIRSDDMKWFLTDKSIEKIYVHMYVCIYIDMFPSSVHWESLKAIDQCCLPLNPGGGKKTDFLVRYFRKESFSKDGLKTTAPALCGGIYYNLAIQILKPHCIHVELQFLVMGPHVWFPYMEGKERPTKKAGHSRSGDGRFVEQGNLTGEQISTPAHQNLKSVCGGHLDFSHRWSQQYFTL